MHVLILPSFYPEETNPMSGIFFQKQAEAVADSVDKLGVVYVEQKSLRKVFPDFLKNRYQFSSGLNKRCINYRLHGISLLNQYPVGTRIWRFLMNQLAEKYIRENGVPDIIHAHNTFYAGFVAFELSKKYGIPYIITEHSSGFLMNVYNQKQLAQSGDIIKNAKYILAVSKKLALTLEDEYDRKPIVVPNIVDTSLFVPGPPGQDREVFKFISVGNLLANKGHSFLISSFVSAFSKEDHVALVICGGGPEEAELTSLISHWQREGQIILRGKLNQGELVKEYQQSDCLILPSENETFGVVLIEALSCGLPVIATMSGGPEDIVNKENGILVHYGDVAEMSKAMNEMMDGYNGFDKNIIRKNIVSNYSNTIVVSTLKELYGFS